jgi:hypothetical protein
MQAVVENPPDLVVLGRMEHLDELQLGRRVHPAQLDHDDPVCKLRV